MSRSFVARVRARPRARASLCVCVTLAGLGVDYVASLAVRVSVYQRVVVCAAYVAIAIDERALFCLGLIFVLTSIVEPFV